MPRRVEILAHLLARARLAVTNIAAAMRELRHQPPYFSAEGMMLSIVSRMEPQNLPRGTLRRQRMQHRQHRRRPNSRTEQHQRPLPGLQNEASARRTYIKPIAHPHLLFQVGSSRTIWLDLH